MCGRLLLACVPHELHVDGGEVCGRLLLACVPHELHVDGGEVWWAAACSAGARM